MRGVRLILATAMVCTTMAAQAQDRPFYVGASYGMATVDDTADAASIRASAGFPASISINGAPFDDNDAAWGAFIGYQVFEFMAVEAGYSDFGRLQSDFPSSGGSDLPRVAIENAHVTLRFRVPVTNSISATWHAGVSRNRFDVSGALGPFGVFVPAPPGAFTVIGRPGVPLIRLPWPLPVALPEEIPFADPKDETGFRWGFGFDWRFARRVSAGLEFSRENVEVLTLDTYKMRLTAHL